MGADRIPPRKSRWQPTFGVLAATTVIAATVSWFAFGPRSAAEKVYQTPVGGHEVITLADGSSIELNTATEIRVGSQWRTVELVKGEAYFQIKHDSLNPFTVLASGHRVIDLGTKFLMRTNGERLQVTLLDGSIRFESASPSTRKHAEVLKPGDIAVATANSVSIEQTTRQALSDASAWRRGMLVFRDATLADAAAEFNRYNQEQIVVHGSRAANLKIDGSFHAENVAGFTNMAQHVLDLHVRKAHGEIAISD
jgi:transmembrane sensor